MWNAQEVAYFKILKFKILVSDMMNGALHAKHEERNVTFNLNFAPDKSLFNGASNNGGLFPSFLKIVRGK